MSLETKGRQPNELALVRESAGYYGFWTAVYSSGEMSVTGACKLGETLMQVLPF